MLSEELTSIIARRIAMELDLNPDDEDFVREMIEEEIVEYTSIH